MASDESNTPSPGTSDAEDGFEKADETGDGTPETDSEPTGESVDRTSNAEGDEPASVTDVETIVVDPEKVVEAVAYNGQEDVAEKGKAVFALKPPFRETIEPTIRHLEDDSRKGKADDEIHIRPFRFVIEGRQVIEQRPTRRLATMELDGEEPSETAIDAWIDEAMETWKSHVRENLVESVDIYSPHGMTFIGVEYREEE